jgi:redox-sensing transcriptional repressor
MHSSGKADLSAKAIGRFSLYRRMLQVLELHGVDAVFSHELASLAGTTPSQVRRDLMSVAVLGNPNQGYPVLALSQAIAALLDGDVKQRVILVGVGNLGRAVLHYFQRNRSHLELEAAFDVDTAKVGARIDGVVVHHMAALPEVVERLKVRTAILTLSAAGAQEAADRLVSCGIVSMLNFTNVRLRVPEGVYVEDTDIGVALERVAYFGQRAAEED